MALIDCPECGNSVSDQAQQCPECGYPVAEKADTSTPEQTETSDDSSEGQQNAGQIGCVIVALVAIVLFMYWPSSNGDRNNGDPGADSGDDVVHLEATVNYTDGTFTITNDGTSTWRDVEFELNPPSVWSTGFTYEPGPISGGESVSVEATNFTDDEGARFNPVTHQPEEFVITAEVNGEFATWTGER